MNLKRTIGAAAGTLLAYSAFAANYYVTPDGDDTNDGQSWATAMRSPELLAEKYTTGAVVINVSNGVYHLTKPIVLAYAEGGSGVVSASGDPSGVVLDCGGETNCIQTKGYSNTFRGLTICNALYDGGSYGGAGLDAHREWMTVRNCVFSNCWCVAANKGLKGGAFYVGNGSSVSNVLVVDCGVLNTGTDGEADGGGCYLHGVDTKAIDLIVTNCAAIGSKAYGGGVYNRCASMTNCRIVGNVATNLSPTATTGSGGGIFCYANDGSSTLKQLKLSNVIVGANISSGAGAGVFCFRKGGANFIDACSIVGNRCLNGANGAGVNADASVFISRSRIADNVTTNVADKGCGAGICLANGPHFVTDCVICDNTSGSTGSGVYTSDGADQHVFSNCVFRGNVALGDYGAFHFNNPEGALLTDSFVISNRAVVGSIGAITGESSDRAPVILRNSYFFGNTGETKTYANLRSKRGGSNSPVQIEYCTFVSNGIAGSSRYTLCPYSDNPKTIAYTNDYIRNFFVTGCVLHGNKGTLPKNLTIFPDHVTYTYADTLEAEYQASELHNLWKTAAEPVFKDPDALDFSHGAGSPLIDVGEPVAPSWMGTGRKTGPQDMGDGHYMIGKVGDYGVTVIRSNAHPRLSNGIPDLGCFEYYLQPGLILLFR